MRRAVDSRILGAVLVSLFLIAPAYADLVFTQENAISSPNQAVNQIQILPGSDGLAARGQINRTHDPVLLESTVPLRSVMGHAGIRAVTGLLFKLTISLPPTMQAPDGHGFNEILFDAREPDRNDGLMVSVLLTDGETDSFGPYGSTRGVNYLHIEGIDGQFMKSVTITAEHGFLQLDHIRFTAMEDGIINIPAPVPEPGTLGMLGTGLIGLAGLVRRKLKTER